jgi:hypothetical protein
MSIGVVPEYAEASALLTLPTCRCIPGTSIFLQVPQVKDDFFTNTF